MGRSLTRKLIDAHLVAGKPVLGEEVGISIDQVLLTDTNGTMGLLQFEAMGLTRVTPSRVVAYVDHNVYQVDSRNSDDHRYMQAAARRYGAVFSKLGNGICHQVHMESFSIPGQTLLGTDSHTPLCGAAGMLALGAGGLDVAVALGGGPYFFTMPAVVRVWLTGELSPWVTAKDVILELLRRLSVRGGQRQDLRVRRPRPQEPARRPAHDHRQHGGRADPDHERLPERRGHPSFLTRLGRGDAWRPAAPDDDASYDDQIEWTSEASRRWWPCPARPTAWCPSRRWPGRRSSK